MPWKKHRRKKAVMLAGFAAIVLLIAILGLIGWLSGWFDPPVVVADVGLPGAAAGEAADFRMDKAVADELGARMLGLLEDSESGMLESSHRLAARSGQPPALRSGRLLAADQLLYGTYLLEQGWQEDFLAWWARFAGVFQSDSGLIRAEAGQDDQMLSDAEDFWRVNLTTLRLLAQSCAKWPSAERQAVLLNLSAALLDRTGSSGFSEDYVAALPTPAPTIDPAATPTPKPTAAPSGPEPGLTLNVLRLATIDLFTLRSCAPLDARWQALYDRYLPIVTDGYISDDLPLYALGYIDDQEGYLSFTGTSPSINTEESLLTILHLCEIGQENPRSLNWVRNQLYNQRAIYESYHIAQGQATSEKECVAGYAIIARIARIKGDRALYDTAMRRLLWHQATSLTSAARSAVFREDAAGLIYVFARDNAMALLAMR